MNKIELLIPEIFPKDKILAGVTKRNLENFPPYGFSVSPAEIHTPQEIRQNFKFLSNQLNIDFDNIILKKHIHSDIIDFASKEINNTEGDGLITNNHNFLILSKIADCVAILLYDYRNHIIGAIHSGWRGTYKKISIKAIEMFKKLGSNPSEILAFISPAAGGNLYEVNLDVASLFEKNIRILENGKFLFDNKMEIADQLISAGLHSNNIEISDICTIENIDYHSFRRDKKLSGRMGAFIKLI